jgi:hypothetical protein
MGHVKKLGGTGSTVYPLAMHNGLARQGSFFGERRDWLAVTCTAVQLPIGGAGASQNLPAAREQLIVTCVKVKMVRSS